MSFLCSWYKLFEIRSLIFHICNPIEVLTLKYLRSDHYSMRGPTFFEKIIVRRTTFPGNFGLPDQNFRRTKISVTEHSMWRVAFADGRLMSRSLAEPNSHTKSGSPVTLAYRIALIFRGSLISRTSRIFNRSRKYFNKKFWHAACSVRVHAANSRNYFNEIFKNRYSRKFRPSKI